MAVVKLYPPNIAGTLPSFYPSEMGTTTKLVVPFSMNVSVSAAMISGFSLRLKTTSTDVVLAELPSTSYDLSKNQITFTLDETIVNKLVIGNFYKVQIAYYNTNNVLGYYSTTSVIKYTNIPEISVVGLAAQSINTISSQKIIGKYYNEDTSEQVYQYQFILYLAGEEVENSGWILHNSQLNTELASSQDEYIIKYDLSGNDTYTIVYNVITNNNLEISSAQYEVVLNELNISEPDYMLDTTTKYDYEKGGVDYQNGGAIILIRPTGNSAQLKGTYLFVRTSSESNYKVWDTVNNLSLNINISSNEPYVIKDYTVAAGIGYKYGLQRYNSNGILQKRVVSDIVIPYFEDAFLYDGTRQLRIRFNPKVSSFKPVVQETKKVTLGRKYPYVLRNGVSNYKEFSISGLVSYLMDNDEMFMTQNELLSLTSDSFTETTDIIDENISVERKFKLAVLEWLNNGSIKLFKSPYEGNYIVNLTGISFSPEESLSRMIHTFSCTATEVAEYSVSALSSYNLLTNISNVSAVETIKIINLNNFFDESRTAGTNEEEVREYLKNYDFTEGLPCRKVVVTYAASETDKDNATLKRDVISNLVGTAFNWGENNFMIGRSGEYEIALDEATITPLTLSSFASSAESGSVYNQKGYLILTLVTDEKNDLDSITSSTMQYLCGYSANGFDEDLVYDTNMEHYYSKNILAEFNTQKTKITGITHIEYRLLPVVDFNDSDLDSQWKNFVESAEDTVDSNLFYNNRVVIRWEKDGKYYLHSDNGFLEMEDYCTNIIFGSTEYDITKEVPKDSIPYSSNGAVNLQISSGVAAYVYGIAQTYEYGVETSTDTIIAAKENELNSYIDLCATTYNFKKVAEVQENEQMFTFIDRKFIKINSNEVENYDKDLLFINKGLNDLPTEEAIAKKYAAYLLAKQVLNQELETLLKEG